MDFVKTFIVIGIFFIPAVFWIKSNSDQPKKDAIISNPICENCFPKVDPQPSKQGVIYPSSIIYSLDQKTGEMKQKDFSINKYLRCIILKEVKRDYYMVQVNQEGYT